MPIQEHYSILSKAIMQAAEQSVEKKGNVTNRGKLREYTIRMIEEREQLKARCNESTRKRIEFAEMNKLIKRQIRDDLREHKTNLAKKIMEDSKSVRKIKKEVSSGKTGCYG